MDKLMLPFAWHFVGKTLRDGSRIPRDGEVLRYRGPLKLCFSGLHWSPTPFQALEYAPGATLCYVKVGGDTIYRNGDDKGCSAERTIIARMDATELLSYFARMQALSVVHLWDAPDVVLDYLMTGDESQMKAAYSAAWGAAAAVGDAKRAATCAAWWDAIAAAHGATWNAARAEKRYADVNEFNQLVYECFEGCLEKP